MTKSGSRPGLIVATLCVTAFALQISSLSHASAPANATRVAEGRYLAAVGDCASCHTREGGPALAGGFALNTPFGTIYSANITQDKTTGIGSWSQTDFERTMSQGQDDQKQNLYPAMPYPSYAHATQGDVDAIFAYLKTVKPVHYNPPPNRLPFPLTIRPLLSFWNWLYLKHGPIAVPAHASPQWVRGAYIVQGLGHCGACHTPKTIFQGDKYDDALQGDALDNWFAPDLNGDHRQGLGSWSAADIVEFLKTGRNARSSASGSMSLVIVHSTSKMSDADLKAIAAYLKSLPAAKSEPAPAHPAAVLMAQGRAVYVDECSACHKMDGAGVARFFPPLRGNTNVQQTNPTTLLHYILTGAQTATTSAKPTPFSMPTYAWKLNNDELAAVATYIRNSWGNVAPAVSRDQVGDLRGKIAAHPARKPPSKV
ncbi:MAG TPA: cytochrome c [Rhizomicrobium sp.]